MDKKWLVRVDFLDHSDCSAPSASIIPITVWGLLIKNTPKEIHILKWCADNNENNHNSEVWAIVKHPGIRIDKIRKESL